MLAYYPCALNLPLLLFSICRFLRVGTISVNAAIFVSVVLASRLQTSSHAFLLIFFAIELFAFIPVFLPAIKHKSLILYLSLTGILVLCIFTLVLHIVQSRTLALVYLGGVVFITFGSPLGMRWAQRYKHSINGPWDIAQPVCN